MTDLEKIRRNAKQIMDEFVSALDKADEIKPEYGTDRKGEVRKPEKHDFPGFKEKILRNAPRKNQDYVIMNKKSW
ncbi:hypothetical protein HYY72_00475 [Candidatus Woesearchaeota archaeon]|nr:hypothetical protein [Candidatus Woesearchaeota archaeon]